MKTKYFLLFSLLSLSLVHPRSEAVETETLKIKDFRITVETASTDEQRQKGLMYRKHLAENSGMLFKFSSEVPICMWMRNTFIPLSVAFIGADNRILNIEQMAPQTENLHCSAGKAKYALEMNRGWFAKRDIQANETINFLGAQQK